MRDRLADEMVAAAEAMEFERAARLRDRIAALSAIQGAQGINPKSVEEADVFAIVEEAGQFAVEVFFFRTYQNWGNRAYYPRADRSLGPARCSTASWPSSTSTSRRPAWSCCRMRSRTGAVLAEALSERARACASRSRCRSAARSATSSTTRPHNGREALARKLADTASQEKLLAALAAAFGDRPAPIRRVEVYDNSHIMGTNAVGAMIVAGPSGFMKTQLPDLQHEGQVSRRATISA